MVVVYNLVDSPNAALAFASKEFKNPRTVAIVLVALLALAGLAYVAGRRRGRYDLVKARAKELKDIKKSIPEAEKRTQAAQAELDAINTQCREQEEKITLLRNILATEKREHEQTRKAQAELTQKFQKAKLPVETIRGENVDLRIRIGTLYPQIMRLENEIRQMRQQVSQLEAESSSSRFSSGDPYTGFRNFHDFLNSRHFNSNGPFARFNAFEDVFGRPRGPAR